MNNRQTRKRTAWLEYIFFGNYFYGICAVALSVEATLQQRFPLNGILYFSLVFTATVLYYNYPYTRKYAIPTTDIRTSWYARHYQLMKWNQIIFTIILAFALMFFAYQYWFTIKAMQWRHWFFVLVFPVAAALYYGVSSISGQYNIRKIGLLKPFIIGFTWAGMVTVYPVLFYTVIHQQRYEVTTIGFLLFLKNMMFVTVLCIMFDIKDYATDYIGRIRTFVVNMGLRKTIFRVLLPLSIIGLATFITYAVTHDFRLMKILLNIIPFLLLVVVALSMRRRHSILYYLIVIDGLMLIKAVCGTIAITWF
jgi:hypothetical protein